MAKHYVCKDCDHDFKDFAVASAHRKATFHEIDVLEMSSLVCNFDYHVRCEEKDCCCQCHSKMEVQI